MAETLRKHGNTTAAKAVSYLLDLDDGYVVPTPNQKKKILIAFAKRNRVVYGKAYDINKLRRSRIDLNDQCSIDDNLDSITIFEIKSTNRELDESFNSYFFALTTAELLVAQNLGSQYKFIFVNITRGFHKVMSMRQVLAKAKGFYPQWSIRF